jgi:hypothetical protein
MIKLGARPGFKPFLPYILPPRKPTKRTRNVLELAFWSENGIGRDEWMWEFRQLVAEGHLAMREDDGWRWFDFELFGEVGFSSVTEYHGASKQLTRVAISRRSPRLNWLPLAIVPWVFAITETQVNRWLGNRSLGFTGEVVKGFFFVLTIAALKRFLLWPMAISKARELALKAAQRAGLQWIKDSDQAEFPIPCAYPYREPVRK